MISSVLSVAILLVIVAVLVELKSQKSKKGNQTRDIPEESTAEKIRGGGFGYPSNSITAESTENPRPMATIIKTIPADPVETALGEINPEQLDVE